MTSPCQRYSEFLAAKGQRLTDQAARVVDAAFSRSGTYVADDLVTCLRSEANRATVFRVIAGLVEVGLLRQVQFNAQNVYVAVARDDR